MLTSGIIWLLFPDFVIVLPIIPHQRVWLLSQPASWRFCFDGAVNMCWAAFDFLQQSLLNPDRSSGRYCLFVRRVIKQRYTGSIAMIYCWYTYAELLVPGCFAFLVPLFDCFYNPIQLTLAIGTNILQLKMRSI